MGDKLLPCPFCGANPHHGLTKVEHCQLHGDPFQRFRIWCPRGCAEKTHPNKDWAVQDWNTRHVASHTSALAERDARIAELEAALKSARYYVEDAVIADGGIDSCEIQHRATLEKVDAALKQRGDGGSDAVERENARLREENARMRSALIEFSTTDEEIVELVKGDSDA